MKCARVDGKGMSIISWKAVLEGLLHAARSGGYTSTGDDIVQLQGLASQMDREAFLPLRDDEVTDQEAARRQVNYVDLFNPIIKKLVSTDKDNFTTKGFKVGFGYYYNGHYFGVRDEFQLWLGVDLKLWQDNGITPLWCEFKCLNKEAGITRGYFKGKEELIAGALFPKGGRLLLPIRLKIGVERNRVEDDAVAQIKRIVDTLLEVIPDS